MPRALRIQYPGAIYHVMNRGDRQEDIFLNDVDRHDFLKTMAEACQKTNWQVHAYCLMRNHFHLVMETPEPNLVEGMRWFMSTYTIRLNHRQKLFGHVFSGRYKALLVDGSGNGYLRTACDYVHLNPDRAGLLREDERLLAYPWSSFGSYLAAAAHRPGWIRVDRLLGEHGITGDTAMGRREFEHRMEARRRQADDSVALRPIQRGWCLGSETFKEEMTGRMAANLGENHLAALHRETAEQKGRKIVTRELKRLGWSEKELIARRQNDPDKLALAIRLQKETTLPLKWIAAQVRIGTLKGAKSLLYQWRQKHERK